MTDPTIFGLLGPAALLAIAAANVRLLWRHGQRLVHALDWSPAAPWAAPLPAMQSNVLPFPRPAVRPGVGAARSGRFAA